AAASATPDRRRAGIHQEVDRAAVDPGIYLEMTTTVAVQSDGAVVGRNRRRRLGLGRHRHRVRATGFGVVGVARDANADSRHHGEQKEEAPHYRDKSVPADCTTSLLSKPLTA